MVTDGVTFRGLAPTFLVADVERTAEWYRDRLGFEIGDYLRVHHHEHDANGNHRDPADEHRPQDGPGEAVFVIITRDQARIMLRKPFESLPASNRTHDPFAVDLYVWVTGVRELHATALARDLDIVAPLEKTFYHVTEFAVLDLDGRLITFGE